MTRELGFDFKFTHKNNKGEVLHDSEWLPNQVSNEGFMEIFDVFFRNATAPTAFKIGLLTDAPTRNTIYGDLAQISNTDRGYAEQTILRDDSVGGFPELIEGGDGNVEIRTGIVEFENDSLEIGETDFAWDSASYAYIASDNNTFIAWRQLSVPRQLLPGDILNISIRQKGLEASTP